MNWKMMMAVIVSVAIQNGNRANIAAVSSFIRGQGYDLDEYLKAVKMMIAARLAYIDGEDFVLLPAGIALGYECHGIIDEAKRKVEMN